MMNFGMAVLGTGSAIAPGLIDNDLLLRGVHPKKPDGTPIDSAWLVRNFGIKSRSLDLKFNELEGRFTKESQENGGLYDGDFSILAARKALQDANIAPDRVDMLIHVSATPDCLHFSNHLVSIADRLGLRSDTHMVHLDLGCAGPVTALKLARGEIAQHDLSVVLVIASHCTSSFISHPEVLDAHINHPNPWTWLSAAVFGDGAGALILKKSNEAESFPVFLDLWDDHMRSVPIIEFPVGGTLNPFVSSLAPQAVYVNYAENVNQHYANIMAKMLAQLKSRWESRESSNQPRAFNPNLLQRWYLHQANANQIKKAAAAMGVPEDLVPINMSVLGNTSAASTLILFDMEKKAGKIMKDRLSAFFWIGANAGAHFGSAILRT